MRKVLIPTKLDSVAANLLREQGFIVVQEAETELGTLAKAHPDAFGLIVRSEKVTPEVIDSLPELKIVVRAGAGYDNIDTKHARRHDIDVMNTPGANANAVAEEVIALVLAAYREIVPADAATRAGKWDKKRFMGRELTGKTVGIVGLGNIGQLVAKRLAGFECRILAYDPVLSGARAAELGVELVDLASLFSQADVVTLHVPGGAETAALVNAELLARMKKGAVLVNCARASVIDEAALRAVKAEKKLLFCNDVYPKDAEGPKTVADIADIMMPHLGASTHEANFVAAQRAAAQLVDYAQRGVTRYVVNRGVPEGLDENYQLLAYYITRVARSYMDATSHPRRIETTFYGGLHEFANWLQAPVALGLASDFDPLFDAKQAAEYLRNRGVEYVNREPDPRKGYGNSVTVDLMYGDGNNYTRVSVRGTLTEGRFMISRIDNFDKLYFPPTGHSLMVVYKDRPGVLAKITAVLARYGLNIVDIRAPQDLKSGNSMAVLKVNQAVERDILEEVKAEAGALKAATLSL